MLAHTRNRTTQRRQSNVRTGLLETDSMVRVYAARVDVQVSGLQSDWRAYLVKKWGPDGLASSVTKERLGDFQNDKAFNAAWQKWRAGWEEFYFDIKDTWYYVRSADKYREVELWDKDLAAWREKFKSRMIPISMPSPSTPGTIPGITGPKNPDVKDPNAIPWTGLLIVGGIIAAASLMKAF